MEGLRKPEVREVMHGQAHGETRQSVYVSLSVDYVTHPVYAEFAEISPGRWLHTVLQLHVRPGSFTTRPGTLGKPRGYAPEGSLCHGFHLRGAQL